MVQNNNRQGGNQHQPMAQNEVVSASEKLRQVLETLEQRGDELAGVLPRDVSLDAFLANVNQALRNNPKLLSCTFASIIDACVKAAYDGLRIDGKEAAIVDANERYQVGSAWKNRMVARYMPMVFGLIKQILQSGAALTVKAVIVYRNETLFDPALGRARFQLLEGTTPGIHHEPLLEGDKGEMIGAYAIAEVQRGVFKHEWMDKAAILDVQAESKTDKVWKRWPTEMWKKTVVRRLRKSLAGTSQIRDMEAAQMFPQFDRTAPHPQLAAPAGVRPTRAALIDQSGTGSGVPLDLGASDDAEMVERGDQGDEQQQRQQDAPREEAQGQAEPSIDLPENDVAWAVWGDELEGKIASAPSAERLDEIWREAQPVFKHAKKAIRDRITAKVTTRNTDLALGGADDEQS
jgi:recombination protein RecT